MARKIITVTIDSSTTATGPYNIYTTSISDDNLLEANVSLANMKAGRTYRVNTDVNQVVIVNENDDCCCSVKIIPINPAPTPSPTTAPTTSAPTTASPTTAAPTTSAPTTAAPTTAAPTTAAPTTAAPTTAAPTTAAPTTAAPTTAAPTTAAPTPPSPTASTYYYYVVNKYNCNTSTTGICSLEQTNLVARSNNSLVTTGYYYNPFGDGFVYLPINEITPAPGSYDLDFVNAPGNANCENACAI